MILPSPSLANLAPALVAAQAEMPTPARDKTGTVKGQGKHGPYEYTYKYADLSTIWPRVWPVLAKHGLAVSQFPCTLDDGRAGLATALIHTSGEWLMDEMPLATEGAGPQAQGSGITYARRYALCAVLGLVADEDDDGAAASKPKGGKRSGGSKPREFDPGVDLAPGAIKVQTEEDADSLRREAASWMPDQPWSEIEKLIVLHLFGEPYEELAGGEKREFYTRFANLIVRVGELAGGGDFPPPTPAQIEEGFAWAFKGMTIALGSDLPSEEAPADELPAEELEGAENAS